MKNVLTNVLDYGLPVLLRIIYFQKSLVSKGKSPSCQQNTGFTKDFMSFLHSTKVLIDFNNVNKNIVF